MYDDKPSQSGEEPSAETAPAKILVVDDSSVSRKKMRMAVRALGHSADMAEDGAKALDAVRSTPYDAILLDIVMPEMDGFDVLRALKNDDDLRDIPVIVISALDDETESVVQAIELGAEDFLPKSFDPVLLKARLGASLAKKRFRDHEREYFRRVERLTEAAEVLESGRFSPQNLAIDDLASRGDALGRLAAVFRGMAEEIYERELRLKRAVFTLQGSLLVMGVGVVWGLTPALSRMASGMGSNPLGLAVWVNAIAAIFCLSIAAYRKRLPKLTTGEAVFFLVWAVLAGVLQRLTTFVATEHVEASLLSLIVTLNGLLAFGFAAAGRTEHATPRRLLGLVVGLSGVVAVLFSRFDVPGAGGDWVWMAFALILPVLFAAEGVFLAAKRPDRIDKFASVGIMMGLSAVMLAPMAMVSGNLMPLGPGLGRLEFLVLLMGVGGAVSVVLAFQVIATAGAVFASQSAYAMTVAGVVWAMLLLDEALSPATWVAIGLIFVGLYLVEPKKSDDEFLLKRSFVRNSENSDR